MQRTQTLWRTFRTTKKESVLHPPRPAQSQVVGYFVPDSRQQAMAYKTPRHAMRCCMLCSFFLRHKGRQWKVPVTFTISPFAPDCGSTRKLRVKAPAHFLCTSPQDRSIRSDRVTEDATAVVQVCVAQLVRTGRPSANSAMQGRGLPHVFLEVARGYAAAKTHGGSWCMQGATSPNPGAVVRHCTTGHCTVLHTQHRCTLYTSRAPQHTGHRCRLYTTEANASDSLQTWILTPSQRHTAITCDLCAPFTAPVKNAPGHSCTGKTAPPGGFRELGTTHTGARIPNGSLPRLRKGLGCSERATAIVPGTVRRGWGSG